jgi:predicted TIM-barrel fold metal-dependent hydrolase
LYGLNINALARKGVARVAQLEQLSAKFAGSQRSRQREGGKRSVRFLPEPARRPRSLLLISVDDHLIEPPDLFEGRLPRRLQERAPMVITREDGTQAWSYEGQLFPNIGLSAVAGRPIEEWAYEPQRFDEMRRGAWDPDARVRDMDINGVYASVCFPSGIVGFGGQRLQLAAKDPDLAKAIVEAVNDWHVGVWVGSHRDRFIPVQIPYLLDAEEAARQVYRNAGRGFKAVTFPEAPHKLGLPSLHTGYWDPFIRACEETGTVVCLHIGSSSDSPSTAPDAPVDATGVLFFGYAMFTAVDWLYSLLPVRFPNIKIALAEGGIAWVPGLIDRLDHVARYHQIYGTWEGIEPSPAEVFHRNFWQCALDDPSNLRLRDRIGVDRILLEVDYPHLDSSWPDSQEMIAAQLAGASDAEVRMMTWENASRLFRHEVPDEVIRDPEAFAAGPATS